jgi:hypothetical protein
VPPTKDANIKRRGRATFYAHGAIVPLSPNGLGSLPNQQQRRQDKLDAPAMAHKVNELTQPLTPGPRFQHPGWEYSLT